MVYEWILVMAVVGAGKLVAVKKMSTMEGTRRKIKAP